MNAIMMLHRAMAGYLAAQGGGGGSKYIEFADPEVFRVLMEHGVSSDGIGITLADAEAVTDIGTWFRGNTEITSFDEFEKFTGVTSVSSQAFYNATALTSIKIPENVTVINQIAFVNTLVGGELILPNVEEIKNDAFKGTAITKVVAPKLKKLSSTGSLWVDGVNYSYGAFEGCANLATIDISKIEEIANGTFSGCANLAIDVNCPSLTSIGSSAFKGSGIVAIESLGKISAVPLICFKGCVNLKTANIRCNINGGNAYQGAFMDCTSLERVEISDDVTSVGAYAFANDTTLNNIYISTNAEIGSYAFQGCSSLTNISNWNEFSSKVKSIGGGAFYQVPLEIGEDLILPNLETLGGNNFNKSSIIRVLDLGKISVLKRADGGLFSSTLTNLIILPETLTTIEGFTLYAQNVLRTIVCKAKTPPSLGSGNPKLSNCTIYVPDVAVSDYQAATNWATHSARIKGISSLQTDNPTLYNEIKDYL